MKKYTFLLSLVGLLFPFQSSSSGTSISEEENIRQRMSLPRSLNGIELRQDSESQLLSEICALLKKLNADESWLRIQEEVLAIQRYSQGFRHPTTKEN
ncbi:MAG: hypothetical protein IBJ00_01370 [Alphaproteobacteria bacterium]|nr:hypothetical protein [Alphaproteobacteria bacterium]